MARAEKVDTELPAGSQAAVRERGPVDAEVADRQGVTSRQAGT
jgi:hypothetical protein